MSLDGCTIAMLTFEPPLNKMVRAALHPERVGQISFACGMDMIKAQVIVQ